MKIAFLHTADVHVATFNRIFKEIGAEVQLDHRVAPDLLDRARRDGPEAVRSDVHEQLKELADADAVLCTCSTLGPLADEVAQSFKNVLRIDRPLMEQVCADGKNVLVALCLDSTRDATLELLEDCAKDLGQHVTPLVVICDKAWGFFEAGETDNYAASIAESINSAMVEHPDIDCIVLAQASMRVAEASLQHFGVPVRSSPVAAAKRCLDVARFHAKPIHASSTLPKADTEEGIG